MLQDNLDDCLASAVSAQTDLKASAPDSVDTETTLTSLTEIHSIVISMQRAIQGMSEL